MQHFDTLTAHKPVGKKNVTKEQYMRYFVLCYGILYPESGMSVDEQRAALAVSWEG